MARKTKAQLHDEEIKKELFGKLHLIGRQESIWDDYVNQYMAYVKNLREIRKKNGEKFNVNLSREERQIEKAMRELYSFMLPEDSASGNVYEEL